MIYAVLVLLTAAMLCSSLLICCKAGERDRICKYGHDETRDTD